MALKTKIKKDSISLDGKTVIIKDITGLYDAVNNPEGYGTPNDARSVLYAEFFLTIKKSVGDEPITISAFNRNTVSDWSIGITEDGYYEAFAFYAKAWSNVATYNLGSCVYDTVTSKFYRSIQASNTNHAVTDPAWWVEIKKIDEYKTASQATNFDGYFAYYEWVELYYARACKAKFFAGGDDCGCKSCGSCGGADYTKIRDLIDGADTNAALGAYVKAQKIVENIQAKCNCK